jgi:hypothetical protein
MKIKIQIISSMIPFWQQNNIVVQINQFLLMQIIQIEELIIFQLYLHRRNNDRS